MNKIAWISFPIHSLMRWTSFLSVKGGVTHFHKVSLPLLGWLVILNCWSFCMLGTKPKECMVSTQLCPTYSYLLFGLARKRMCDTIQLVWPDSQVEKFTKSSLTIYIGGWKLCLLWDICFFLASLGFQKSRNHNPIP
jgi:hypothetical protein